MIFQFPLFRVHEPTGSKNIENFGFLEHVKKFALNIGESLEDVTTQFRADIIVWGRGLGEWFSGMSVVSRIPKWHGIFL